MRRKKLVLAMLVAPGVALTPPLAAQARPSHRWSFQVEMTGRYDDNITELSDRDRGLLGTPACNARPSCANRFRIKSPDDFILVPSGGVEWSRETARNVRTSVRAEVRAYAYARNPIKNYWTHGVRLSQDIPLAPKYETTLILRGQFLHDFYLRELTVPEESRVERRTVRDSARFSSRSVSVAVRQVLVPEYLELEVLAGRARRDYDAPFDERDGNLNGYGADLLWHPLGSRRIDLRAGYRSEPFDAEGDRVATPALEPDISSSRGTASLGVDLRWGRRDRRGGFSLDVEREKRDFLSRSPADTFHFGRQDRYTQVTFTVRQGLRRSLYLEAGLTRERNDSHFGPGAVSSLGDEVTDYTHTVLSVSIGRRF